MTVQIEIPAKLLFHQAWIPQRGYSQRHSTAASVDTCIGYLGHPFPTAKHPALFLHLRNHRQVQAIFLRALDGFFVSSVGVAHDAGGGIIGKDTL